MLILVFSYVSAAVIIVQVIAYKTINDVMIVSDDKTISAI